jgi:hypothetical protein
VTTIPHTATSLLAALADAGARPRVEERELVCDSTPPESLDLRLAVLHTGVRALLARRPWYGCNTDTGFARELNPTVPIPAQIGLLCVEGDGEWDRIRIWAWESLPDLFSTDAEQAKRPSGQAGARSGRRVYFIPLLAEKR